MPSFRRAEYGYAQKKWVQPAVAVAAVGSGAASVFALYAAITMQQPVFAGRGLWLGVVCVLMARTAMLKVEVRPEGVHVVNPWRTDLIRWSDFAGFARKRWLLVYPRVVFVVRRSGRPIPVLVLMGGGFFIGGDDSRVDDAVLDLEDRVRAVSSR